MEKKHISIIGSCVSREMFNSAPLKDVFCVDGYAFKVCIWDLFGEGLGFPREAFDRIEMPSFYARMLRYGFEKNTLSEIAEYKSEYLLIDLLNIKHDVDRITYKGKSAYIQDMHNSYSAYADRIKRVEAFSGLEHERISALDIPAERIVLGLQKLSEWAKSNYAENKIIINNFAVATGYYSLGNKYLRYDEEDSYDADYSECEKYARVLKEMLPGAVFLEKVSDLTSQHALYDGTDSDIPSRVHFTNDSYVRLGENMLQSLNINYKEYFPYPASPLGHECCILKNAHVKLNAEYKSLRERSLGLGDYMEKFDNLDDFIFLITSKDGVVFNAPFQRAILPIVEVTVPKAHKFAAIISTGRGICNYRTSPNQIELFERIDGVDISVHSMGWGSTSTSVARVNAGEEREYPFESAGVNMAVLNARTFELVDLVSCNTDTADLIVVSDLVKKFKITV